MLERVLSPLLGILPVEWLIRGSGQHVYRPMYHTVQGDYALPHIRHLYEPVTVERFERDLDVMLRYFQPVSYDELVSTLGADGPPPARRRLFLTFDDGLREVLDVALPVLKAKGVPATVFVNSAFVGNRDLFFRYLASALIERLEAKPPTPALATEIARIATDDDSSLPDATADATPDLRALLLGIGYARREVLQMIAERVDLDVMEFLATQRPYLDVDELERLQAEGFTIGAHSIDHPLYRELDLDEQIRQTRESCDYVRATLQQKQCSFAFPFSDFGVSGRYFERVRDERIADHLFGGRGYHRERFANMTHRQSMEGRPGAIEAQLRLDHVKPIVHRLRGREFIQRG